MGGRSRGASRSVRVVGPEVRRSVPALQGGPSGHVDTRPSSQEGGRLPHTAAVVAATVKRRRQVCGRRLVHAESAASRGGRGGRGRNCCLVRCLELVARGRRPRHARRHGGGDGFTQQTKKLLMDRNKWQRRVMMHRSECGLGGRVRRRRPKLGPRKLREETEQPNGDVSDSSFPKHLSKPILSPLRDVDPKIDDFRGRGRRFS